VVRVPGYRSRGPASILGANRFSENGVPLSLVSTIEEPLGRNSSGSGLENVTHQQQQIGNETKHKIILINLL
jgi:hypothetical protein